MCEKKKPNNKLNSFAKSLHVLEPFYGGSCE